MPLAVRFLPERKLVPLLCLAVIGAPMARMGVSHFVPQYPAAQYVLTPCRVDSLAMGVLLAIGWRKQEWKARFLRHKQLAFMICSLFLIAVAYLAFWNPSQYSPAMGTWGFSWCAGQTGEV
jgi:peptidoglycan/LPS O-acetylase OafA/YrhL